MTKHTQQLQQLYFADAQSPKILDTRPRSAYLHQRLKSSVNIDLLQLTSRCYLLPDKPTAFAVLLPSQSIYTVTADASQHGQQLQDGSIAVYLKGTSSLQVFFTSRGWTVSQYLADGPQLWAAAAELGLLEQQCLDLQLLTQRCLFAPSQLLSSSIILVEQRLAARRLLQQQQQAPILQAKPDSDPGHLMFRALDVGCGSGRDTAWLASRQRLIPQAAAGTVQEICRRHSRQQCDAATTHCQLTQVRWHVTGVDEWLGALERAHDLAQALLLTPEHIQLVYGAVNKQAGDICLLHLPHTSKLQSAMHAAVVHADVTHATGLAAVIDKDDEAALRSDACNAAADSKAPVAATTVGVYDDTCWQSRFDLILCVRFLERALLPRLRNMLNIGGFIMYSAFVDGPGVRAFGRPSGSEHVLQPGELAIYFGPAQGFCVVEDRVMLTDNGRELCHFVAQLTA